MLTAAQLTAFVNASLVFLLISDSAQFPFWCLLFINFRF